LSRSLLTDAHVFKLVVDTDISVFRNY